MNFKVSGKQIDIGEALREHVMDEMTATIEKYAQRPTDITVVFSKDAYNYTCEAIVNLPTGLTAQAKAAATDIYAAFELCREKMDKQLRRHKRRLRDHQKKRANPIETLPAQAYILAANENEEEEGAETGADPVIIAEMETRIPSLSVSEAVMQMELAGSPVLVFRNERDNGINVVYRRDDGNIGWIDPRLTSSAS